MLTGISQAASVFTNTATSSACCPDESPADNPTGESPCSNPDCLCCSCFSSEVPVTFVFMRTGSEEVASHYLTIATPAAGYGRAIEYPPESA